MAFSFILMSLFLITPSACMTLGELTKAVDGLKMMIVKKAYFQVRQKDDLTLTQGTDTVLKFQDVTMNYYKNDKNQVDTCYDKSTGKFTAPYDGKYMFWAHVQADHQEGYQFYVRLMKNDQQLAQGFATWNPARTVASLTYITELKKGDKVWFAPGLIGASATVIGNYTSHYGGTRL